MARLPKRNADYHSHPSGWRNDPRVKSLRRKFKHEGYSIYTMVREVIAGTDYFHVEFDNKKIEDLAGDFDAEPVLVAEIIEYCIERTLFQKIVIDEYVFITDHGMIRDLTELLRKRNVDSWDLISGNMNTAIISATEMNESNNNRVRSAQSKVNDIKLKESSEVVSPTSPASGFEQKKAQIVPSNPNQPKSILDEFLSDTSHLEAFAMRARQAGVISAQTSGPDSIEYIRKMATDYWPTFLTQFPKGNYQKFGFRLGDHINDLASGKITKSNTPQSGGAKLSYSINPTNTPLT